MSETGRIPTITGATLRARVKKLGLTYTEAARRLGLTRGGLNKQMDGINPVSRQTEIILAFLERQQQVMGREVGETLASHSKPAVRRRRPVESSKSKG